MQKIVTLSQLTYDDLMKTPAWMTVGDSINGMDIQIEAVIMDNEGNIPAHIGEVWCLCRAIFANGSEHLAICMCRGDSDERPLLCSVWNGTEDIPVILPPAPAMVLDRDGPAVFASRFNMSIQDAFPMTIIAIPHFAVAPAIRIVKMDVHGIL